MVIFQPAEEGGAGGKAMVEDGLMERWNIQEVYGLHNMPGLPVGQFALRPGALLAATDEFNVTIRGVGAHAAFPQGAVDPVIIATQIVQALQVDRLAQCRSARCGGPVGYGDQGRHGA